MIALQSILVIFVEYKGYWLANYFAETGPIDEYVACRQKAVIMDLSPLRKFEITGRIVKLFASIFLPAT